MDELDIFLKKLDFIIKDTTFATYYRYQFNNYEFEITITISKYNADLNSRNITYTFRNITTDKFYKISFKEPEECLNFIKNINHFKFILRKQKLKILLNDR